MSGSRFKYRASTLHRRVACPGSAAAELDMPDVETKDAAEGTMLHAVLSGTTDFTRSSLTASQEYDVRKAKSIEQKLFRDVFAGGQVQEVREKKITLFNSEGLAVLTGHPDLIMVGERRLFIVDYKLGPIPVTAAESNWQLAAYAVAAADLYEIEDVYTAIIQPRDYHGAEPWTLAQYTSKELETTRAAIHRIMELCETEDAPRRPSLESCRYCNARGTDRCPETQHLLVDTVAPYVTDLEGDAAMSAIHERVAALTPHALGDLLVACDLLTKVSLAVQTRARKLLKNGERVENDEFVWGVGKGATHRTIVNNRAAVARLVAASNGVFTATDVAACSDIGIGSLDDKWKVITGKTAKEAKADLDAVLGDAMEKVEKNGSIIKTRKGKA